VLHSLHRFAESLGDYEQALLLAPDSVLALNNRGMFCFATVVPKRHSLFMTPRCSCQPELPDTLYNRGAALRELRRYGESAQSFVQLLKIDPEHAYAFGQSVPSADGQL